MICLVLTSFQGLPIRKRITISSMNYKKHNAILLASNLLFAMALWLFYGLISFVIVGKAMFSAQGAMYLVNSFVFTLCALTMAFLISSIFNNKEAVNGIVNVVALGSAFLCGAFEGHLTLVPEVLSFLCRVGGRVSRVYALKRTLGRMRV